ncbi:glucose 1-dehydrogenase [Sporanaerobacter sp. PP17-6a]|uniref:glucose 1-dehydrogenase n=1 Tax=Sporanaerobacter sp. PP17-6a TaxID=1891289 RepID=UPI0008A09451|nr:glucose 1-dehydrogenase [Sporanaerobacter sp. PP17-6a]SCL89617.1 2-dehydro-3-deoxy-D-gluconate 5-dehydrogenase [Sporanaerobacter sp. PP17-6a]
MNLFDLTGKVAVVTGGSSGNGQSIAYGLAQAGADVAVVGNTSPLNKTKKLIESTGRRCLPIKTDLRDIHEAKTKIIDSTMKEFGRIDILVNNAGIQRRNPVMVFTEKDWDDVLAVNLKSVFILSQGVAPIMQKNGWGKIINMASMLSFQGGLNVPAYAASKGGIAQLTKAMANEWSKYGINVNAMAPGYIVTKMNTALISDKERSRQILERIPAGRWGEPTDLIGGAIFLSSHASDYVDGHVLCIDGGWMGR